MTETSDKGDRIAKVMARAGIASRRDAEKMILAGRVAVNGEKITSPALDVAPSDKVTLDGKPIDAPQPARLWLYYKPVGLVTSAKDEKGRQTVFDTMPAEMPRVMSVGRLDLTSEGLLLLTNDGELKRRLELPSTGWLRKYRVRVNGRPNDATFDPLRRGATIEGEEFLPMDITLDKQQGANAWLTVGLREGKNREIRRAMSEVGLIVNRLIRVSYGPFRLNMMKPGDVVEVKQRILREQLGTGSGSDDEIAAKAKRKPRAGRLDGKAKPPRPRDARSSADGPKNRGESGPRERRADAEGRPDRRPFKSRGSRNEGDGPRRGRDEKARTARSGDEARPDRKPFKSRGPHTKSDAPRDDKGIKPRDGGGRPGRPREAKPGKPGQHSGGRDTVRRDRTEGGKERPGAGPRRGPPKGRK